MERYSIVDSNNAGLVGVKALRREFIELEKRANKRFDWYENYFLPIHIILSVITGLIFGISMESIVAGVLLAIAYGLFGGIILTFLLAGFVFWLFEKSIERLWLDSRLKSKWYVRYIYLKDELPRIDRQIESEKQARLAEEARLAAKEEEYERRMFASTFELLDQLHPFHDGTTKELFKIHQFFSRKTKWYEKYGIYEEKAR